MSGRVNGLVVNVGMYVYLSRVSTMDRCLAELRGLRIMDEA